MGAFQQILKSDIEMSLLHLVFSICLSVRTSLCRRQIAENWQSNLLCVLVFQLGVKFVSDDMMMVTRIKICFEITWFPLFTRLGLNHKRVSKTSVAEKVRVRIYRSNFRLY